MRRKTGPEVKDERVRSSIADCAAHWYEVTTVVWKIFQPIRMKSLRRIDKHRTHNNDSYG